MSARGDKIRLQEKELKNEIRDQAVIIEELKALRDR